MITIDGIWGNIAQNTNKIYKNNKPKLSKKYLKQQAKSGRKSSTHSRT